MSDVEDLEKVFWTFLKKKFDQKGTNLSNYKSVVKNVIPAFIQQNVDAGFSTLFNVQEFSIVCQFCAAVEVRDLVDAPPQLYICINVLRRYAYFCGEREGLSQQQIDSYIEKFKAKEQEKKQKQEQKQERAKRLDKEYEEGGVILKHVSGFERDRDARAACLEYYKYKCAVCGFDFEAVYGEIGKDFIEVHHLHPLSQIRGTHDTDPIKDLRPLCSNCHSMIHRGKNGDVWTIDELKEKMKQVAKT